ncbi:MAG TPA: DUF6785 family protein [Tepidisphaeraceae bacterium]|nr:DUF6785 family protein [Tepidisphaeraceae bacterium]
MTCDRATPLRRADGCGAITFRACVLGLAGAICISLLTPWNDLVLNNTFLIGNNLPTGVVMLVFGFVVFVNAPLRRWAPRHAFTAAELTVALGLMLVSCCIPSSGLMRTFPGALIGPWWIARNDNQWLGVLEQLHLPRWIWPSFDGPGPRDWIADPVLLGFVGRWTGPGPTPYTAWLVPGICWGVFTFALFGALLCMVAILRRQWVENERLAFPLTEIYLALIEEPDAGRAFSHTMRRRSFWIAFAAVFALYVYNGLWLYIPEHIAVIPIRFDLRDVLVEGSFRYLRDEIKQAQIFFTAIGVCFFLPTSVSLSLWIFFVLHSLVMMLKGRYTGDPAIHGEIDQHFGAFVAFAVAILWMGRRHWRLVLAQALRGPRASEPRGRYLSYPAAAWGLVLCSMVMVVWLCLAGAGVGGAIILVILLLSLFLVITRVVAETGLFHAGLVVPFVRHWTMLQHYGWSAPVSRETVMLGSMLEAIHYDMREPLPVYASHAIRVADRTLYHKHAMKMDAEQDRRRGRCFIALMLLTLLVAYLASFASALWCEYRYAGSLDAAGTSPLNPYGVVTIPQMRIVNPTMDYVRGPRPSQHAPLGNFAFGAAFTAFLSWMRWNYTWWPLHPVGYLLLGTFPSRVLWFSALLGWAIKLLTLRFGGSRAFTNLKPLFVGLIVGESLAAGFWLAASVLLHWLGLEYKAVSILPW